MSTTLPQSAPDPVGVMRYLDVSTGHIKESTADFLSEVAGTNTICQTVAEYEYGYFVGVPEEVDYDDRVPEDLRRVLDFARARGCAIVCLDRDGETLEDLPTWDW